MRAHPSRGFWSTSSASYRGNPVSHLSSSRVWAAWVQVTTLGPGSSYAAFVLLLSHLKLVLWLYLQKMPALGRAGKVSFLLYVKYVLQP